MLFYIDTEVFSFKGKQYHKMSYSNLISFYLNAFPTFKTLFHRAFI